jgi:hypothetical protein
MRDLLDTITNIEESVGLANRKAGDVFRNPKGEEIVFNELTFYPAGGGQLEPKALEKTLKDIVKAYPNIQWQNEKTAKTGGFGVASFTSNAGPMYIGRYFNNIKPSKTDNYISNKIDDFNFSSKAATKAQSGLSPQDLLVKKTNLSPSAILKELAVSLGKDNPLYDVALKVATGTGFPVKFKPPKDTSFTGFRDYFCEILQPMALISGMYSGNAGEAAEIFLDGTFDGTLISFDDSKNAGLSDSILARQDGKTVKVSTKGGKGAQASAKNLVDGVNDLKLSTNGRKLLKKYKDTIELIEDIQRSGQNGAPLMLGVKFNLISQKDADMVASLRNAPLINLKNIDNLKLTPKLKKLALKRDTNDPKNVNIYYHLLAAIAHDAAEKVNKETDFSKAAADILNNGALIQVYTKAKESKGEWVLEDFETVYPSENIKGVWLSAGKTYYSTGIKGNFTFKIDKTSDKSKGKEPNEDPVVTTTTPAVDLAKAAKSIVTKKLLKPKARPTATPDVGREKRKR